MLWLISTNELRSISGQDHARSAGYQYYRIHTPAATISLELLDLAYQKGSLHVITAAPKRDYSLRITLNPDVSEVGDYLGVVLGWTGNINYQHEAIVKSASAPGSLGLGILRPVFEIRTKWLGPQIVCDNMLNGIAHPDSETIRDVLHRRQVVLSKDQVG